MIKRWRNMTGREVPGEKGLRAGSDRMREERRGSTTADRQEGTRARGESTETTKADRHVKRGGNTTGLPEIEMNNREEEGSEEKVEEDSGEKVEEDSEGKEEADTEVRAEADTEVKVEAGSEEKAEAGTEEKAEAGSEAVKTADPTEEAEVVPDTKENDS